MGNSQPVGVDPAVGGGVQGKGNDNDKRGL